MAERILIVEDDPTLRRILLDNLIFEGYRAEAVADGQAAINYVRSSARIWSCWISRCRILTASTCARAAPVGQGADHHSVGARQKADKLKG